ncbi:hypothetical protein CHLNCDRAFT_7874, partial [Chlorella variabilis]
SLNQVLRALKREEGSLYNCVASIADDALFVAALYPSLPLFPNLRCGVWYVRPPIEDSCYFKSTDGHNGNWSFSAIRLNLNLAEAAAAAGGCLVVDATKRGKRFPDAMSKTVPMWAAVMNRAVQQLPGAPAAVPAADERPWDCDVHLPAWVSANEANSIRQLLEGWVDRLLEVGADLSALAATLRKPLRCMWVSQDSRIWLDSVAGAASLPFTPIILVGASATTARQRRCLTLPPGKPAVTYSYFPGAADDEESWACGLTPQLMWRHLRALLAAGPAGIEALVRQLVEEQQQQAQPQQQQQQHQVSAALQAASLPGGEQQVGCLPAQAATVQRLGGGIYLLGSTGLAISGAAAAAAPAPGSRHDCSSRLSDGPAAALASCRYCWLPVRSSKLERHSLLQQLPAVLRCARAQLQQGRRLLVCCDSGLDVSVCVAVACLLAFYRLHEQPGGGSRLKLAVRQHLAAVSAHYPAARPTRGSLRQVFNF